MKRITLAFNFAFVSLGLFAQENPSGENSSSDTIIELEVTEQPDASESTTITEKKAKFKEKLRKILDIDTDEPEEKEEKAFPLSMSIDIVSRYVWRGSSVGTAPNIQPDLSYSVGDKVSFTIGAWGNYTLGKEDYAELDLYASLTTGPVTFGFYDYGYPLDGSGDGEYFTYRFKNNTSHSYEVFTSFDGVEKFPLTILVAESVGGDIDHDEDGRKDYDNVYVEFGYPVFEGIDVFLGMGGGVYLTPIDGKDRRFNVVNIGLTASRILNLGNKIKMPISASLIFNPDARNAYFVATIGLAN